MYLMGLRVARFSSKVFKVFLGIHDKDIDSV